MKREFAVQIRERQCIVISQNTALDLRRQNSDCILIKLFGENMSKFNIQQYENIYIKIAQNIKGSSLQYFRNQYTRFEEKGMKTVGVADYII